MILVHRITNASADAMTGEATFEKGGIWTHPEGLPIAWSIELIAQVCAAFIGSRFQAEGFLGGRLLKARDLSFTVDHLPYDRPLLATIKLKSRTDTGFFVFDGTIFDGPERLAHGTLSILAS